MNTSKLKIFAQRARVVLLEGVRRKLLALGFDAEGDAREFPRQIQGATLYRGEQLPEEFYEQWRALYEAIQQRGVREVVEEVAYTWFNRLTAIRILHRNGFIGPVLSIPDPAIRVPVIVAEARAGRLPAGLTRQERLRYEEVAADASRTYEQFLALIVPFCRHTPLIHRCFGAVHDYTELLLPANILEPGGFLDLLNQADETLSTHSLPNYLFSSPEVLGWLYQFYISERKDEVFAKKGKYDSADIPAATQIFTPNWIVKYMVQNAVLKVIRYQVNSEYPVLPEGAHVLEGLDTPEKIRAKYPYLILPETPTHYSLITYLPSPEEIRVADLACGSGHILIEVFNLLHEVLVSDLLYTREEAARHILRHNITGLDIDERARQLATFALLLRACQVDSLGGGAPSPRSEVEAPRVSRLFAGPEMPRVYSMHGRGPEAETLGSIQIFDDPDSPDPVIAALSAKYDALVMNPPYMPTNKIPELSAYVNKHYPDAKTDMYSVFMERSLQMLKPGGRLGVVTMEAWMFLSSFEKFRTKLLRDNFIISLSHFGWHVMGIAFGTVSTIIEKSVPDDRKGIYSFLTIDDINPETRAPYVFPKKDNGRFAIKEQSAFAKIPGSPIGYWVSDKIIKAFEHPGISQIASPCKGIDTGENEYFLRCWWEPKYDDIDSSKGKGKYVPYNKGGGFRRWYGFRENVLYWNGSDEELRSRLSWPKKKPTLRNKDKWFKESFTWSTISGGLFSIRYSPQGALYDSGGNSLFSSNHLTSLGGFLNSKVAQKMFEYLAPTINYQPGDVGAQPIYSEVLSSSEIDRLVEECVAISKEDWDAHETSWDFQGSPLLERRSDCGQNVADIDMLDEDEATEFMADPNIPTHSNSLSDVTLAYEQYWEKKFLRLHANEEELNRRFIEIYGLQDELMPDVPWNEVTILQQGEVEVSSDKVISEYTPLDPAGNRHSLLTNYLITFNRSVLMRQLLSYAVGTMMGRYRLDRPGLAIAHQDPTEEDLKPYSFKALKDGEIFEIDDDAIIPLMPEECPFADNAPIRMSDWVRQVFGDDTHVENLNFIEACLGMTLADYFQREFWKDHLKMYQRRPIYWLFSSRKGAFRAIAYMHRMNPFTAQIVREKYLLRHIDWLRREVDTLMARQASLTPLERRTLKKRQADLDDCREYDVRLHAVANQQISLDLDAGVAKNYQLFGDVVAPLK